MRQPTTSGWTWLFLFYALHQDAKANRLSEEKAALQRQYDQLSAQLKTEQPAEWESVQQISSQLIEAAEHEEAAEEAGEEPAAAASDTSGSVGVAEPDGAVGMLAGIVGVGDEPSAEIAQILKLFAGLMAVMLGVRFLKNALHG